LAHLHFFSATATDSPITWSDTPTIREFADYNGTLFSPVFVNGGVGNASGIEDAVNEQILIYPNPAKDFIVVKSKETIQEITIVTSAGKVIFNQPINAKETRIPATGFRTGLLMVQIHTRTGSFNKSLMIEK